MPRGSGRREDKYQFKPIDPPLEEEDEGEDDKPTEDTPLPDLGEK